MQMNILCPGICDLELYVWILKHIAYKGHKMRRIKGWLHKKRELDRMKERRRIYRHEICMQNNGA